MWSFFMYSTFVILLSSCCVAHFINCNAIRLMEKTMLLLILRIYTKRNQDINETYFDHTCILFKKGSNVIGKRSKKVDH